MNLKEKVTAFYNLLRKMDRVVVALSGGVDSSVLLKLATDSLSASRVQAITFRSITATSEEMALAEQIAKICGVTHRFIEVNELAVPEYAANPVNRCYHCQRHRFQRLQETAIAIGNIAILDGSNQTDLGDFRPGQQALKELGIRSPLRECSFTKDDIRQLAESFRLPNRNRPSNACLASRLPYGIPVTKEALEQIAAGEELLAAKGFTQCRLRHHGAIARLEVPPTEFAILLEPSVREDLVIGIKKLGYTYVALDLQGYRTGSMNESPV